MKVITVWQPWASLIAVGAKKFETRGWATSYRGPIAIHAAMKSPRWVVNHEYDGLPAATLKNMMAELGLFPGDFGERMFDRFPRGAVIATADLVECWKIERLGHMVWNKDVSEAFITTDYDHARRGTFAYGEEIAFGDWTPGRYAWQLENVMMLDKPIPAKGMQRLWNWEAHP